MSLADQFEEVPTPVWEDRFGPVPRKSIRIECTTCHADGYDWRERDGSAPHRWWGNRHEAHVLCTCGKVLSVHGIGPHRGSMKRHGNPCPPLRLLGPSGRGQQKESK